MAVAADGRVCRVYGCRYAGSVPSRAVHARLTCLDGVRVIEFVAGEHGWTTRTAQEGAEQPERLVAGQGRRFVEADHWVSSSGGEVRITVVMRVFGQMRRATTPAGCSSVT